MTVAQKSIHLWLLFCFSMECVHAQLFHRKTIQNWNRSVLKITYSRQCRRAEGMFPERMGFTHFAIFSTPQLNSCHFLSTNTVPKHCISHQCMSTTSTTIIRPRKSVSMATEAVYMLEIEFLVFLACLERAITYYRGRHKTFFA